MDEKAKKLLAIDIVEGKVFGTWGMHERDNHILPMVFMPLALMKEEDMEELKKDNPAHIYEYISEAGPRSINGYPIFWSMHYITEDDWEDVRRMCEEYQKKKEEFIGASDEKSEVSSD